jgi:hypothetical protein
MSSICQYHNGKVMYFFIGIVITYVSVFGGLNVRRDMSLKCQMGLHAKHSNRICGIKIPNLEQPVWRCTNHKCRAFHFQLDSQGPLKELFGRGCVNSARTLLALAHIVSAHGSGYCSSYELACHAGVGKGLATRICDTVRKILATEARREQASITWSKGSLLEADEASMRVKRIPCKKGCKIKSCGKHEEGFYRLLHHRFMVILPRGRRELAKYFELPQETCEAGGSGVSLSAKECDAILPRQLSPGPYTLLTDGAGAYQSVAPRGRLAFHTKDREPNQFSVVRHNRHYKRLNLSHGVVSHSAEQWAVVHSVKVVTETGKIKVIKLKKGTECADGVWPEMRGSIPNSVHTSDWERCQSYIWSWVGIGMSL